jgi:histidinol phosphatase-like PHP family hydrolase
MKKDKGLIDLHTHSLLSDGLLLPSELVRRYEVAGFSAVAITDHVDLSNIDFIIEALVKVSKQLNRYWKIKAIPGVELTHIPLQQFSSLVKHARKKGAMLVIAHGESPVEPVIKGTNRAAIQAGVDILAHPGKITKEDVLLAAKNNICLEITTRKGHSTANAHVANMAKKYSAKILINSDSHSPENIPLKALFEKTAKAAGLSRIDIVQAYRNSEALIKKIC